MAGEMLRTLESLDRGGHRPIVVASHPRSGTHLCIDTLRLNFPQSASRKRWFERADRLYLDLDLLVRSAPDRQPGLIRKVLSRVPRPIIKTHSLPDFNGFWPKGQDRFDPHLVEWLRRNASWVYVHRDGRDVLCSLQRYSMGFDPTAHVPLADFIRQCRDGMTRVRAWANHVRSWMAQKRVLCVTMDQLLHRGLTVLPEMAAALGSEWNNHEPVRPRLCDAAFLSRLKRRIIPCPASTAVVANPRFEQPADWRNAFTASDRQFFEDESGGLLVRLGYEASDRWVGLSQSQPDQLTPVRRPAFA